MKEKVDVARFKLKDALSKLDLQKEEMTGDLTLESFLKLRG